MVVMKSFFFIKILFILFGTIFVIGGFLNYQNTQKFLATSDRADAIVIDLISYRDNEGTVMYRPLVQFTDNRGKEIIFSSSNASHPPAYKVNEKVTVAYKADNSNDAKIISFMSLWFAPMMFMGLGSLFALIGGFLFKFKEPYIRDNKELKQTGIAIQADINNITIDEDYSKNGRHPYIIYAQWQDLKTSKIHLFQSMPIWYDPTKYIKYDTITVFIDPDNPQAYYMDIEFLPELAAE